MFLSVKNMDLTKEKLVELIESLDINSNEGIINDENNECPRIVYWDYVWEPLSASGNTYNTIVTYQVSFMNYSPPRECKELLTLIKELSEYNKSPIINHEYVEKERIWHSYFSIDVLESL